MDNNIVKPIQIFLQYKSSFDKPQTQTLTLDSTQLNQTIANLKSSLNCNNFFFTLNGRILSDASTPNSAKLTPFSTLALHPKLLGGGGDGGATGAESRDCYLNMYAEKKPDKVDPNEKRISKWTTCALSFEPLKPPCVVDRLGNVFNKEALVKGLISKSLPKAFGHIRGLKDMVNVVLTEGGDGEGRFMCPVSGLEFNGKYKFVALRKCGHVLSGKAIKEVKSCGGCIVCRKEYGEEDVIVVNGSEEEVAVLRERMRVEDEERRKCGKASKKEKSAKGKAKVEALEVGNENEHGVDVDAVGDTKEKKERKDKKDKQLADHAPPATVSAPAAKRFRAVDTAPANANKKVYASIFTSSRKTEFKETYSCRSLPLGRN